MTHMECTNCGDQLGKRYELPKGFGDTKRMLCLNCGTAFKWGQNNPKLKLRYIGITDQYGTCIPSDLVPIPVIEGALEMDLAEILHNVKVIEEAEWYELGSTIYVSAKVYDNLLHMDDGYECADIDYDNPFQAVMYVTNVLKRNATNHNGDVYFYHA